MNYIYTLSDPITGDVRYVGKSIRPDGRYKDHIRESRLANINTYKISWIKSLISSGLSPVMDIIDERHNKTSTIMTSQIPVSGWHDVIGEGTIADAILDRIVNSSHRINLEGESLRKRISN